MKWCQGFVFCAIYLAWATVAEADQIYRWVDDNGKVHYSDRAPELGKASTVNLPKAPPQPSKAPANSRSQFGTSNDEVPQDNDRESWVDAQKRAEAEGRRKEEKRLQEENEREQDQEERRRQSKAEAAARDQKLIDRCNANRETYCDDGVGAIKSEETRRENRAEDQRNKERYERGRRNRQ